MSRNRKRTRGPSANTTLALACSRERCHHCGGHATLTFTREGKIERSCLQCR